MKRLTPFVLAGLLSFIVYLNTLAPTITWANAGTDSGDLATAVAVTGVPHPTGYPTYLLLAEIFKRLPSGDVAYRLNLLSAACAALTVTITGLLIYRTLSATVPLQAGEKRGRTNERLVIVCALSVSLTLAFSGPFWSQAVITEVYALHTLLASLLLWGLLELKPANESWLVPASLGLFGLSLGNHLSIALLSPMLLAGLAQVRWRRSLGLAGGLSFCLGLSVYLIIPIRAAAGPPVNWGVASTWSGFWWLVSAAPYRQFLFTLPWAAVPGRVLAACRLLAGVWMGWGLLAELLGFLRLRRFNHPLAGSSFVAFGLISLHAIGYNTTDSYVYLLPALLLTAWWAGWGLYEIGTMGQRLLGPLPHFGPVNWGLMLLPLLSLLLNFSGQNISRNNEAYLYAQGNLQAVPPGTVIITADDAHTFALWYGRYALALRPDVAIVDADLLAYAWYRQILGQTHPYLLLTDPQGRPLTTLPAFLEQNRPHTPIHLARGGSSIGQP